MNPTLWRPAADEPKDFSGPLVGDRDELQSIIGYPIPEHVFIPILGDRVVIARAAADERTAGGIIMPTVKQDLSWGWVLAVGPLVHPGGYIERIEMIGRCYWFGYYAPTGIPPVRKQPTEEPGSVLLVDDQPQPAEDDPFQLFNILRADDLWGEWPGKGRSCKTVFVPR